ncbi:uncharacterized protein HD556DRAFT_1447602 [Suillus plorans]|uniref:Carrier domain-containing protein n=1 Tax=Suillus plorans TaxID=116603 RepID=A0A9P7AGC4_9AGAM|nr:uncharacterized protein HD556DRAFT_1447602 [Suillus plorans]KAG1788754.1 hypothetical protein HD556DRAFT_1447602 [Suillus plorans]
MLSPRRHRAADWYPLHELGFINSSAHDSSIQAKTFSMFNQYIRNLARAMLEWGKPTGSIIVVHLTEDEDNMAAVWACLLSGYLPCLQPVLEKGHVMYITKLFGSATWLASELGAEQITSISADWVAHEAKPDDAILFLTPTCEARSVFFVVPSIETEKVFVKIYASTFNLVESEVSMSDNFFEIGGTSLDATWLKCEGEKQFDLPDIPAIQILKHLVLSSLAHYVDSTHTRRTLR